jgi:hypothetical protein
LLSVFLLSLSFLSLGYTVKKRAKDGTREPYFMPLLLQLASVQIID